LGCFAELKSDKSGAKRIETIENLERKKALFYMKWETIESC
jgi:hypothetical protein